MPEGGTTAASALRGVMQPEAVAPPVRMSDEVRTAWRQAAFGFTFAFVAWLCIFIDTAFDLVSAWTHSGTFAHGYIILPVSAWLIWRMRAQLAPIAPRVQPLALVPLLGCGMLWLAGDTAGVHTPTSYAFVAMLPCIVWGIFGNAVTKRILFPLAFLFFAVPAGDFLMPTLMDHTADFTIAALRISGVPVYREGNYFSIPSGNWSVVEACSGLRYLIASLTLGCLFAYLNYRRASRRIAFVAASIVVPIVANWLRAYLIVMIAHLSSNALATGVDHIVYGWLFFGVVMMALFWVGSFWREDDEASDRARAESDAKAAALDGRGPSSGRAFAFVTIALMVVAAPWPVLGERIERIADAAHPGAIEIGSVPGWSVDATPFTDFVPHYQRSRSTLHTGYVAGDRRIQLFVAYYSGQATNGPLVTYDNDVVVLGDKVWGAVRRGATTTTVNGEPLAVAETVVRREDSPERLLAWRWYWINGRLTTSDYLAKAYTAFDKITGRGDDSAVIVVTTPLSDAGPEQARATAAAFVAAAEPRIVSVLADLREEGHK